MEALTPGHLAVILVGFLVLFGYRKLPEASRSLGRSLRIFRSELRATGDVEAPARDLPAELEAQARAAEAEAAALRARAGSPDAARG